MISLHFFNMMKWYNYNCKSTHHTNIQTCEVSREITIWLSRLIKGFNLVYEGSDRHVVVNT